MDEAKCPDADELAEVVRSLFAGGSTAGGITRELSNGQRYYIIPESSAKADHDNLVRLRSTLTERDAVIAEMREALTPFSKLADEAEAVANACGVGPDGVAKTCTWSDLLAVRAALQERRT